jgi:hypothetical protein
MFRNYAVLVLLILVTVSFLGGCLGSEKTTPVADISPPQTVSSLPVTPQQTPPPSLQTTIPVSQYSRVYTSTMTPANVKGSIVGKWIWNIDDPKSIIVKGEVFGTSSDIVLSVYPGSASKGCPDFKAGEGAYSEMKFSDQIPVTPKESGYGGYEYVLSYSRWNDGFYYMILTLNSGEKICMSFALPKTSDTQIVGGAGSPGATTIFRDWISRET